MKFSLIFSGAAVATATTCSLFEIGDGSCGQSDLDCAYVKYAKAAETALADGTCADQGYTVKTGTQTKSYPIIGDIVVTTYDKAALASATTCSLFEIGDGSCGQSDLDCAYVKYAKAAETALADGTCADQGYTVKTGTQTKSYPIIGDIVVTTYDKAALATAATCSLFEIGDGSCGQSDLDCAYVKYAKAAETALADGTCPDQGYTVKTGTQTKSYPIIGDIVVTTYDKVALSKGGAPSKIFLEGFIEGFIGKADHIKACIGQSVTTEHAVVKFIKDAKARKWDSIISDIQTMIGEVTKELPTCKGAGQDLAPIFTAFKDVHSIKDVAHKLKENFLANDRAILDIVEDMLEVCTFGAPDAHKCGKDLGKQSRAIVIGSVSKPPSDVVV